MSRLPSILKGTNAEVFKKLLLYYKPPPAKVIDVTCGYRHFWTLLKPSINTLTLHQTKGYEVVFNDIRPIGDYQYDYREILKHKPEWEGVFDAVVYDPPYTDLTLKVEGVDRWIKGDRYGTDSFKQEETLSEEHFQQFAKQAYRLLKSDGVVIAKLQDTVNWWHFKFYNNIKPLKLEALYIHDLGSNWAEYVEVKNARKPIPKHAYWFILVK